MKNKKAFTLIELLAVIIILGILMIIAIPAVTSYINNSRKSGYITSVKQLVNGGRNLVNEGKLDMYSTDTTYYIPASYIKTENGLKTPYGDFTEAYIGVIFNGTNYKYYWISTDTSGTGIKNIVLEENLDEDDIESDLTDAMIHETITTTGIGNRTIIKILKDDGTWDTDIELANTDNNVSEEGGNSSSYYLYFTGDNPYYIGYDIEGADPDNNLFENYQDALNSVENYSNPGTTYQFFTRLKVSNDSVVGFGLGYYMNGDVHYLIGMDSSSYNANRDMLHATFGISNCEDIDLNSYDNNNVLVKIINETRCVLNETSTNSGMIVRINDEGEMYIYDKTDGVSNWQCVVMHTWNSAKWGAECGPMD